MYKSNEDLLRGVKEPLAIPTSRLILKVGGPEIRFRMLDPSEPLISVESSEIAAGMSSSSTAISPPATTAHPSPGGWQKTTKGPESLQMEKQITPAEKAFSPDKLAKLKVPFGHGEFSWECYLACIVVVVYFFIILERKLVLWL